MLIVATLPRFETTVPASFRFVVEVVAFVSVRPSQVFNLSHAIFGGRPKYAEGMEASTQQRPPAVSMPTQSQVMD